MIVDDKSKRRVVCPGSASAGPFDQLNKTLAKPVAPVQHYIVRHNLTLETEIPPGDRFTKVIRMRIGVSLFQFYPALIGGAGEILQQVIPRLLGHMSPDDELVLFGTAENLAPFSTLEDPRIRRETWSFSRRSLQWRRLLDLLSPWPTQSAMVQRIEANQLDVLWWPQQSAFPRGVHGAQVGLVVDVLHRRFPQYVTFWQRWLRIRKERQFVATCQDFVTISEATRKDWQNYYAVPAEHCTVMHLGGRPPASPTAENPAAGSSPYVYYPAHYYPHKNHRGLIDAWETFRARNPQVPARLVLSGKTAPELLNRVSRSSTSDTILHLGFLSGAQVAAVYRDCRAVVLPTLFEGFGMPLIEGLQAHKPVYASDLPVFRELVGEQVSYFSPGNQEAMVGALDEIFLKEPREPDWERLIPRLESFTWDRAVQILWHVLRATAIKSPTPTVPDP